jgi:lipoprotein-releasing system permease protein
VVGDRVEMLFVDHKGTILRDKFELSGIYSTGVDFLDEVYAFTDMRNVARLYDGDSEVVTGYELWLEDGADPTLYKEELNDRFVTLYFDEGIDVEAFTIEDIFPDVFGWLATHDVTAILVVIIMLVVALLNMATALLIIVLERETMIGVLRALGMGRKAVLRIFLYRSLFIVLRGVLWGAFIGFVVVLVQHLWRVIPLPTEGYLLDAVPTAMCWGWWCLAIVGSIVVTLLCMLLPATFATRISPVEIMRYE